MHEEMVFHNRCDDNHIVHSQHVVANPFNFIGVHAPDPGQQRMNSR